MVIKGSNNEGLHNANRAKKDEFYTQRTDIEKELKHYKNWLNSKYGVLFSQYLTDNFISSYSF